MIVVLSFFSAKPIDLLARYIGAEDEVDAVEMHEPYTYLNGLATKDLEDLIEDIKVRGWIMIRNTCRSSIGKIAIK